MKKPGASVFWVSARNEKEIEAGFREFANKLSLVRNAGGAVYSRPNLTATAESAAEIGTQPDGVDLLKNWMLLPGHEDWLLVLDNLDDIEVKVDRFFPRGAAGSVLITTRDRNVIGSVATSGFHLTAMDLLDAERLFIRIQNLGSDPHLQGSASGPEHQILRQILEELQCFPLAIDQAASFIRENSPMTLREYQTYLKPRSVDRERLLRFKQANPTYPDSVMTTWELSLHYLERNHPRAGWILQLLGFLDHSYISEELLVTATKRIPWIFDTNLDGKQVRPKYQTHVAFLKDDVEFRAAIGTLVSLSLIQRHMAGATLHVHPLVHEWIRVRLNPEPEKQARFTIVGALLLFQYLPAEMLVWLCSRPKFHLQEVHHRINQVSHHIGVVLSNLTDYAVHATETPLECFLLCEVYFLAGFSRHSDLPFGVSTELSQDLDRLIKMMISRMPHDQRSFAGFVHKVILWLGGSLRQKDHMASVSRIADSLESLQAQVLPEECPDEFFMLVAHCVVDVCDILKHTFPEKLVFDNDKNHKKIEDRMGQFRRTSFRLLEALRNVFSSIKPLSTLLRRTHLAITIRLLTVMAPEEYATQNWLDIEKTLSSNEIGHLDFDEKAAYLCLLAQLLWEYQGPKDFLGLQRVFSAVISECSAMRENERRSTALERDRASMHAMSRSRYISSSFGREVNPKGRNKRRNIITPLNYMWTITPILAETTSDPKQQWRNLCKEDSRIGSLDLSQRRWSLDLISSISKIYRRYCAERGIKSDIDARYFNHFDELSVRYCLINIYANLEDWQQLKRELVVLLQCDEVLRFCNRFKSLPWEHRKMADTQGDNSSPPPSQTPQQEPQQTSWLLLATRPFRAAKNLVTSQVSQTHGASKWSAESSLVTKLQEPEDKPRNMAAEIEARLEAAAAQRQSRAPSRDLGALLARESELEEYGNKTSKVQSLGLPDSCNCIADRNVGKAIAQFFTLAQKLQILNEEEANDLRLKIRVVAEMPSESFAKYLGNFEIIYQLAQKLSARFPDSMHVEYASDDDGFGDPSHAVSLDDETDEEVNDEFELGISLGMAGLDWGW